MKHTNLDACRRTLELLPWYTNDSLDAEEKRAVKSHLAECIACRREWVLLGATIESMPSPVLLHDNGSPFGKLLQRINREERQRRSWKVAAAVLVMVVGIAAVALPVYLLEPRFQTVTDAIPEASESVQVRIQFDAQVDIGTLTQLLERYDAEVIAGPDADRRFLFEFPLAPGDSAQQLQARLEEEAQISAVELQKIQ